MEIELQEERNLPCNGGRRGAWWTRPSRCPWIGHDTITLSEARSRLDQRRFSRPNTHFAAFFKLYKNIILSQANLHKFAEVSRIFCKKSDEFLQNFRKFAKACNLLQNLQKFCKFACEKMIFLVDLEKCCKMRIWTRKSALIQPRTSLGKSDGVVAASRHLRPLHF